MSRSLVCLVGFAVAVLSIDAFSRESDRTCAYLPRLVSDAAQWKVDEQERGAIDTILSEALELCADGKKEEAQELIETTNNERIMDWRREGAKKHARQERN